MLLLERPLRYRHIMENEPLKQGLQGQNLHLEKKYQRILGVLLDEVLEHQKPLLPTLHYQSRNILGYLNEPHLLKEYYKYQFG